MLKAESVGYIEAIPKRIRTSKIQHRDNMRKSKETQRIEPPTHTSSGP